MLDTGRPGLDHDCIFYSKAGTHPKLICPDKKQKVSVSYVSHSWNLAFSAVLWDAPMLLSYLVNVIKSCRKVP